MKINYLSFQSVFMNLILVTLFFLSCGQKTNDDLYNYAQAHKSDLRFGTYITVGAVNTCLNDTDGRREALSVMKSLGITKAFIETYRGGRVADEELLITVRDFFTSNGIDVIGGIATVPGKDFGVRQEGQLGWFNFQHPKTQHDLENVVRLTARVFDEMIIDDFLCTADTSELSSKARGDRSWSQYRMDMLTDLSENLFIKPAREENPDITIIIKYPQWYDRFHLFGYDLTREPELFDKVWVGTETRGPDTRRMGYVKQYEGFVNFCWISSFAPEKMGGAWFDHIDCKANDFIDQAYQSILAGAREIIFFNYFNLMNGHPGHHLLRRRFSTLMELAGMVRQESVKGICGYKPPHSDAESDCYILDYMGMIGVPLIPTSQYPADADVIFLPTQAAADQNLMKKVEQSIADGKTIIITAGLLKTLSSNQEFLELTGIKSSDFTSPIKIKNLIWKSNKIAVENDLFLPAKLKPSTAKALLNVEGKKELLPFLTVNDHASGGKLFVLNVCTYSEKDFKAINEVLLAPKQIPWLDLPDEWLNVIREAFLDPLKISFKGRGRISLHLFGEDNFVICNFNDEPVEIDLDLKDYIHVENGQSFINRVTGEKIQPTDNELHLSIGKRQILWVEKL